MFGLHTPSRSPAGNCNISNNFPVTAFTPRMNSSPRLFCPHTPGAPAQSSSAAGKGPGPGIGSGFSGGVTGGVGSVQPSGVVGDVGEPLWVQLSHPSGAQTKSEAIGTPHPLTLWDNSTLKGVECNKDWSVTQGYSCWSDPDDLSMAELKKFISEADKRMFWEMAKAIIELPEISHFSNSSIKNAKDLAMILKKPEYKILWTAVAADILPRQAAAELVTAAYVEI